MRRIMAALLTLTLLCLCQTRAFARAPEGERVEISETDIVIDMASGEPYILTAKVYPEEADQELSWYVSSRNLITVVDGVLTPHKTGEGWVMALIPGRGHIRAKCTVKVIDTSKPLSVSLDMDYIELEPTRSAQLKAWVNPDTAPQEIIWKTNNEKVARVTQDGVVTAVGKGQTSIYAVCAQNQKLYARARVVSQYLKAPDSVTLNAAQLDAMTGDTFQIIATTAPEDASSVLGYASSDKSVARVDAQGLVKVVGYGTATITVRSMSDTRVNAKLKITAADARVPDRLVAYPSYLELEPSQSRRVSVLALPQSASGDLNWISSNPSVATVNEQGVVTALKEGNVIISACCAYSDKRYCQIPVKVKFGKTPTKLDVNISDILLNRGESAHIEFLTGDADASRAVVFESSNASVAYVDEEYNLIAAGYGEAEINAYCLMKPRLTAKINVKVEDMRFALTMEADRAETSYILNAGETLPINFTFTPATADTKVVWTLSNESIVKINAAGVPEAVSGGRAQITAANEYNPALNITYDITVRSDSAQLEMPMRRTGVDDIAQNLERIESVRKCALDTIKKALESGDMTDKEASKRETIVNNAFDMYAFAWMVEQKQLYWKEENSEEGAKDFKEGIVYYGMPYISGYNSRRSFTFARALEEGYYLPVEGQAYYVMNKNRDEGGSYVGSDCSSFVSLAFFKGTIHDGEAIKTTTLYSDDRFTTLKDAQKLKTGDIFVRWGKHVAVFLYWANDTQIVVIEQGGVEPAINTVSTSIYDLAYYMDNNYRMRSLRNF